MDLLDTFGDCVCNFGGVVDVEGDDVEQVDKQTRNENERVSGSCGEQNVYMIWDQFKVA